MKSRVKAKASRPTMHIVCAQEGCSNVRQSADQAEWKEYCTDHIEQMPYVQELYLRMQHRDPEQDREHAEDVLEEFLKDLVHNR